MKRIYIVFTCLLLGLFIPQVGYAQQTREQLASYYYSNGQFEQAVEIYESLYQRTANQYYYQMLHRSYLELGRYRDAERLIEKRMRQNPKDLYLYVDLGELYLKKNDAKKAEKQFDEAISKVGYDTKQINDLVMAFEGINRLDYGVKAYLAGRQKTGNKFQYINELATLYGRMGNYEAMTKEYFDLLDNSPGSMNSIQISLQRALNEAPDGRFAEGLRRTLINRVQSQPNNKCYLDMMIWFSLQQKDFAFALTQAKAVDARFSDQGGETLLRVARIAQSNADYDVAKEGYAALVKKGSDSPYYFDARVGGLEVEFERINKHYALTSKELTSLRQSYEQAFEELGKNERTIPLMRHYATLMAYYANEVQTAVDILYDIIEMPRIPNGLLSEVKLDLGDMMLFAGEVWEASLLYMQVEKANKNDVVGAQAKFRNARLSYFNNDFLWAKSQLDVLRASTSKLIANDAMELSLLISDNMEDDSTYDMLELYAAADLLLYRNLLDSAWDAFDDISHRALSHPLFDEVLLQKAKIRMRQGRYAEADSLLQKIVDFYPEDIHADDALMMLGQLNEEQLNNIERARSCYEQLLLDYPVSLYVDQARKRYNKLKNQ